MMWVRFPTGYWVQYNRASYASRAESYTDLYDRKGGHWIAQVPNDAMIEVEYKCADGFARDEDFNRAVREEVERREATRKRKAAAAKRRKAKR